MQLMGNLFTLNGMINTFFLLCIMIGGFFAFRYGQKKSNVEGMKETILVLSGQVAAIKESLTIVEKENEHHKIIFETILSAMKQKGIIITVEGEMVTIDDGRNQSSSLRRSTRQTTVKQTIVKKEAP